MAWEYKRIVCLANSYKPGGRCIAGRELLPGAQVGQWVRPIGTGEEGGVGRERLYEDGSEPEVLDVMDVPVLRAQPEYHQTENWLIYPDYYWEKINRVSPNQLERFVHTPEPLWLSGYESSNGRNDRIPFEYAKSLKDSLRLIKVSSLEVSEETSWARNAMRLRGHFQYAGQEYALRITDLAYSTKYFNDVAAGNPKGEVILTVSMGGQFYDYVYKLIAAIIDP